MSVENFVMFLGPVRTGHTFIASRLTAHKNIAISIESSPFLQKRKLTKKEAFQRILRYCKEGTNLSRGGYNYTINGLHQTDVKDIKVIGDDRCGFNYTKELLKKNKINDILNLVDIPIKWILVLRNPFDVIQSSHNQNKNGIEYNLNAFITTIRGTEKICKIKKVRNNLLIVYFEDFVSNPKLQLKNIISFLSDVEVSDNYLNICLSYISKPKNYGLQEWSKTNINRLNKFIKNNEILNRYQNEIPTAN